MRTVASLAAILALVIGIASMGLIYPATMEVVEIDREREIFVLETWDGDLFEAYGSKNDLKIGSLVSVIMWSNGTDDVTDDEIISIRPTGFRGEANV